MTGRSFLAATRDGVARLVEGNDWTVDQPLAGVDVYSLAAGPAGAKIVIAGTDTLTRQAHPPGVSSLRLP